MITAYILVFKDAHRRPMLAFKGADKTGQDETLWLATCPLISAVLFHAHIQNEPPDLAIAGGSCQEQHESFVNLRKGETCDKEQNKSKRMFMISFPCRAGGMHMGSWQHTSTQDCCLSEKNSPTIDTFRVWPKPTCTKASKSDMCG